MAMPEVSFESTQTVEQQDFSRWVESRARWDLNHYELLNGRIVMTPPAGYPRGSVSERPAVDGGFRPHPGHERWRR